MAVCALGWAISWWNDRSFPRTNGTIKNDPNVPKKHEHLERVLQNFGTISKRTERNGNCLKRTVKIVNVFLFQERKDWSSIQNRTEQNRMEQNKKKGMRTEQFSLRPLF